MPTAANGEYYARIVREKAIIRNLIHTSTELLRDAYDGVNSADELLGMAERPDAVALLAHIVAPTLVITGADDTLIPPAESEKMVKAIRGAQLNVIPRAGHLVAFEQPDAFNRVLKEWLNRPDLAPLA